MILTNKTPNEILDIIKQFNPEIESVIQKCEAIKLHFNGAVQKYQAACIYALAKPYNGGRILEIGLGRGYSTSYLASACPDSEITSLSISYQELKDARVNLKSNGFKNVKYVLSKSVDFYQNNTGNFDFIFVDGDHKHVASDLIFWNVLNKNGLFLFHDYCEITQPVVWNVLNEFATKIDQSLGVLIVDNEGIGLAGFYRHETP